MPAFLDSCTDGGGRLNYGPGVQLVMIEYLILDWEYIGCVEIEHILLNPVLFSPWHHS